MIRIFQGGAGVQWDARLAKACIEALRARPRPRGETVDAPREPPADALTRHTERTRTSL